MALNTRISYFSNSIQGIPMAGVDVNVETVDLAPRYAVGYWWLVPMVICSVIAILVRQLTQDY